MERSNYTVTDFSCWASRQTPGCSCPVCGGPWCLFYDCAGNASLTVLISNDSQLHTPTYFFTGNLSFLDLWYSSVYTPKILVTRISEEHLLCRLLAQFCSGGLAYSECCLLAAMAADRCTFISKPPVYSQAMSMKLCAFFCSCLIPWWLY